MEIIVCIKQVPDTNEVRIDPEKGTLIRKGVPSIINPDDKNALEEALRIKDKLEDVNVTVLSMGPSQAKNALREALAMGADKAILLSDRAFAGSDTWATSTILAGAIKKIKNYDIIFCGRQAIDGDTAQVGPQIAEHLEIPQITYVENLDIEKQRVKANRAVEDGYYIINSEMPVLLTAIKELNKPRYESISGIYKSTNKEIEIWGVDDIVVDTTQIGLKGSPTRVKKTETAKPKKEGELLKGSTEEAVNELIVKLKQRQVI